MCPLSLESHCSKKANPWLHASKCPHTQLFPAIISFSITACEQGPEQTLTQTALDLQGTEVTIITTIDITFGSWKNLCLIYFLIATNVSWSPQYYGCGWLYGRFLVRQEKSMEPNKRLLKEAQDTSAVWPDSPHCRWFKQVYQRKTPLPTAPGSSGSGKDILYPNYTHLSTEHLQETWMSNRKESFSIWPCLPSLRRDCRGGKGHVIMNLIFVWN